MTQPKYINIYHKFTLNVSQKAYTTIYHKKHTTLYLVSKTY